MNIAVFETEPWENDFFALRLSPIHNLSFHPHAVSPSDNVVLSACEALVVFVFSKVDSSILNLAPQLRLIATRSTGFDHIDRAAAKKRGISVANVPEYGSNTVAEHTFALLLTISRRIIPAYFRARERQFTSSGLRGFDLRGKTLGVVGTGNIGLHVIRMAASFNMRVIAFDKCPRPTLADVLNFEYVPFDVLLTKSDVISLHCPATLENHHLINVDSIDKMKTGIVLLNTARGSLINTRDLLAALESGKVSAAGLDVIEGEQALRADIEAQGKFDRKAAMEMIDTHQLLARENVIITPHNAFHSEEAMQRILDTTIANIEAYAKNGAPAFPVIVN